MALSALEALHAEIRSHAGCGFEPCESATNMVPGEGDPGADVMVVGEAPGRHEDEQGRPFVGALIAALLYEYLYLGPAAPPLVGTVESGVAEPRPGDTALD